MSFDVIGKLIAPLLDAYDAYGDKETLKYITRKKVVDLYGNHTKLYLIHTYLYYIKDLSVVADYYYDKLCVILLAGFEHQRLLYDHNEYLNEDELICGTGFNTAHKIAGLTKREAEEWYTILTSS